MRNASKLAALIAAFSIAGIAAAEDKPDYDALDTNNDNKISKSEAKSAPGLADRWDELDVDQDNNLNEGEFARFEADADVGIGAEGGIGPDAGDSDPVEDGMDTPDAVPEEPAAPQDPAGILK